MKNLEVVKRRERKPKVSFEERQLRKCLRKYKNKKRKPYLMKEDLYMITDRLKVKVL
jgi:hypothetical protein